MELGNVELRRNALDQQLDGFFDFVEVARIGKYRIVHRESKTWLGIIDDQDNILTPLVYDEIEIKGAYIGTTVRDNGKILYGALDLKDGHVMLPAKYSLINMIEEQNMMVCYNGKEWSYVQLADMRVINLPHVYLPLDHPQHVCVLHKCSDYFYRIECWNENQNHSEQKLRSLALNSECPNRIKLTNISLNLVIYADIYGQILFSNRNLNELFK